MKKHATDYMYLEPYAFVIFYSPIYNLDPIVYIVKKIKKIVPFDCFLKKLFSTCI